VVSRFSRTCTLRGGSSSEDTATRAEASTSNCTSTSSVLTRTPTQANVTGNHAHAASGSLIKESEAVSNETMNASSATNVPLWKQRFPDVLRKKRHTFHRLTLHGVAIYLLGTAHVSNDSCREVQALLEVADPDCVFVELCEARIPLLTLKEDSEALRLQLNLTHDAAEDRSGKQESMWSRAAALQQTQGSSRLQALSTVMLTSVQEEYAKDLGVELGGEFQAAYQFWKSKMERSSSPNGVPPVHFVLGDRPMHLTLRRAWESLWWWPKTKVVAGLLWSCLFKPNPDEIRAWLQQVLNEESDILTKSFEEMRRHFPTLHRVIIQERDAYLAAKLTQTCQQLPPGSVVVALVGAGHVPGMCSWLVSTNSTQTPEQVLAELITTRQKSGEDGVEPELVNELIQHVTALNEMPDESFAWAQPHQQQQLA
jgi:pheromone shutdown protein TraB